MRVEDTFDVEGRGRVALVCLDKKTRIGDRLVRHSDGAVFTVSGIEQRAVDWGSDANQTVGLILRPDKPDRTPVETEDVLL